MSLIVIVVVFFLLRVLLLLLIDLLQLLRSLLRGEFADGGSLRSTRNYAGCLQMRKCPQCDEVVHRLVKAWLLPAKLVTLFAAEERARTALTTHLTLCRTVA